MLTEDEIRRLFGRFMQQAANEALTHQWCEGMLNAAAFLQAKRENAAIGLPCYLLDYPEQRHGWTGGCAEQRAENIQ